MVGSIIESKNSAVFFRKRQGARGCSRRPDTVASCNNPAIIFNMNGQVGHRGCNIAVQLCSIQGQRAGIVRGIMDVRHLAVRKDIGSIENIHLGISDPQRVCCYGKCCTVSCSVIEGGTSTRRLCEGQVVRETDRGEALNNLNVIIISTKTE